MFRRDDGWIVPQWEHSRLSGDLAAVLCAVLEVREPRLCGAIALHDWPHFCQGGLFDPVAIGDKSEQQQRQLLAGLAGPLPVDPLTELLVLMHWRRLSAETWDAVRDGDPDRRIEQLQQQLALSPQRAAELDRWTQLCDVLSFHACFGHDAGGSVELARPFGDGVLTRLDWQVAGPAICIRGGSASYRRWPLSLCAFQAPGYPRQLTPVRLSLEVTVSPE